MKRLLFGLGLGAFWLLVLLTGATLLARNGLVGVILIVIGLLGFVLTFASSFPQSTQHARDE